MECERKYSKFCKGEAIGLIDGKPCCDGCREFNESIEKFKNGI